LRILQINKYYYVRGGAERYLFTISRLLEEAGHEVIPFSMRHERNEPTEYDRFFLPEVDYRRERPLAQRLREGARVIWNDEAFRRLSELIAETRPDVAHLHNIAHQLSGSVVAALAWAGVPAVQSLHDYKMVCPAYRRFRDGKPCDSCYRYRFWEAVRHSCVLESRSASLVAAVETGFYEAIGLYRKGIRLFHSPSRFLKETMERWGVPGERIIHFPNTIDVTGIEPSAEDDGSFLFLGRLSHEKGLPVLLDAAARLPSVPIVIAGEGPEKEPLQEEARRRGVTSVHFAGFLAGDALADAARRCRAFLLPSEYDDNLPTVALEAFAYGKPVIGAERGGIPEMVRPGETGLLFPPSDGEALARAIRTLHEDGDLARELGRKARLQIETTYGPAEHLPKLLDLYRRAMGL